MIIEKSSGQVSRWFDPGALLIQLCLITTLAVRLSSTGWASGLDRQINLVLYAFILGVWLGQSRFRRWISIFSIGLYGLIALFWSLALLNPLDLPWLERIAVLVLRIRQASTALLAGQPIADQLLFLTISGAVLWIVTAGSAFSLVRDGSPWYSLITVSILLLLVDRYNLSAEHRVIFFFSWMLFTLLLAARSHLLHEKRRWQANHSLRDSEAVADITRVAWGVILGLLAVVWIIPAMAAPNGPVVRMWRDLTRPMDPFRERAANAFAPLQGDPQPRMLFSSNYLSLGIEISQESIPVMQITGDALPAAEDRFYWRARNFNTYENGVWTNTDENSFPITADWRSGLPVSGAAQPYQISVEVLSDHLATLYTEQNPSDFSLEARAYGLTLPDGSVDLHRIEPQVELAHGAVYTFQSQKTVVDADTLAASDSTEYPEWVTDNYLAVPPVVSEPVSILAHEVIGASQTPYEKTVAITRYLRENYLYDPSINPPPDGTDPTVYFLFSTRRGFCTYYATAEVLLLRAVNVPARIVVGFSQGERLPESNTYLVQMKNLHAWPEVYIPEYGWVPMEPTVLYESIHLPPVVDQAALEREQEELERRQRDRAAMDQTSDEFNPTPIPVETNQPVNLWPIAALALVLAAGAALTQLMRKTEGKRPATLSGWVTAAVRRSGLPEPAWLSLWHTESTAPFYERQFRQIARAIRWLDDRSEPGDTPAETGRRWRRLLPAMTDQIDAFITAYQLARFSPHPPETFDPQPARQIVRAARLSAFRRKILNKKD